MKKKDFIIKKKVEFSPQHSEEVPTFRMKALFTHHYEVALLLSSTVMLLTP